MATKINLPANTMIEKYSISLRTTSSLQRSPYSMVENRLDFGGELWEATLTFPVALPEESAALQAWADRLSDPNNVARFGPPPSVSVYGTTEATTLTLAAAASPMSRNISVLGIGNGQTLLAGTYISISDRLYRVRQNVTGGSGATTVTVTPRVREAHEEDTTVLMGVNARGVWILGEPPSFSSRTVVVEPVTMSFSEALLL